MNDNQSRRKSDLLLRPLFYCTRLTRKMFIDQALYEKERDPGAPCLMCLRQERRDERFRKRLKGPSNFLRMPMRWKLEKYHLNQMRNLLKEKNLKRLVTFCGNLRYKPFTCITFQCFGHFMTFISIKCLQSYMNICDFCWWFSSRRERDFCTIHYSLELQSSLPGVSRHSPPCNLPGHSMVTYEMQPYKKNCFQVMHVLLRYIHVNCFIVSPWNAKWHIQYRSKGLQHYAHAKCVHYMHLRHQQAFSIPCLSFASCEACS